MPPITISCVNEITLDVGQTFNLEIECSDKNATISFHTSNANVASIDEGVVTGLKKGNATIRVRAENTYSYCYKNIKVKVEDEIKTFEVSLPGSTTLYLLDKNKENAYEHKFYDFIDFQTSSNFKFSLSHEGIIEIKDNRISALSEGSVTVTFTSKENPLLTSSHEIIVTKIDPSLNLSSPKIFTLKVGDVISLRDLSYTITPNYYFGSAKVNMIITNQEVIQSTINNFVAISAGESKIKIFLNDQLFETITVFVQEISESTKNPETSQPLEEENTQTSEEIPQTSEEIPQTPEENLENEDNETPDEPQQGEIVEDHPPEEEIPVVTEPDEDASVYTVKISAISNCTATENQVTANGDFILQIAVLDEHNTPVTESNISIEGIESTALLGGRIMFMPTESCQFTIKFLTLNFEVKINLILT